MTIEFPTRFGNRLSISLLILRLSLGLFLLLWALEKFILPQTTEQIWASFYQIPISGGDRDYFGGLTNDTGDRSDRWIFASCNLWCCFGY